MARDNKREFCRRELLRTAAAAAGAGWAAPNLCLGAAGGERLMTRKLGRTRFDVTTLGLGGQGSLQWTPADVKPEQIIVKAVELGVNYFDTSNVYGSSQMHYGKAFRALHLIPGTAGYDEKRRRSIFLASKTLLRPAKGTAPKGVNSWTQGPPGSTAVDDLRRTLSLIFGDGKGNYPRGAYVDLFQLHDVKALAEIDALWTGLDKPDPKAPLIGAVAALRDYRDGTNLTGLNPKEEKLIRHIGFSGHFSAPMLMEVMQRDKDNLLETMLVVINANDRLHLNQQYNSLPVAAAKGLGVIAMKVFADGAMYTKEANWTRRPEQVVRTVGSPSLPSRSLVQYTVSTPGVSTAIIGIGHIDGNPQRCQLCQNLSAAQIQPGSLSQSDRRAIEQQTAKVKDGHTNWFQAPAQPLTPPREPAVAQEVRDRQRMARITWHTAYAGDEPIRRYEIRRDGRKVGQVEHRPQTSKTPFSFEETVPDQAAHTYELLTVDAAGRTATTEKLTVPATG
ncbi:MAG: aldo/keto reductase [Candidatus Nealsonbacteria bacterium]|nr:aldo/keto reductase [Candidatus Nealsonbacteria bacterium]